MEEARSSYLEVLEWISGKRDDVDRYFGYPKEGTKWFLVSQSWLNNWKQVYKLTNDVGTDEMQVDLGKINNDDIILNDDHHHITGSNHIIKPDLRLGTNFEALPLKAWRKLKKDFGCDKKIKRLSIESTSNSTSIEISLLKIRVLFVIDKQLKDTQVHYFHVSRLNSVKELIDTVSNYSRSLLSYSDYPANKLWKLDIEEILQKFNETNNDNESNSEMKDSESAETQEEKINKAISKLADVIKSSSMIPFEFPGVFFSSNFEKLTNFENIENEVFVLETRSKYNMPELFKEKRKEQCEFCRKNVIGARRCFCKKYFYCDDKCEDRDRNYHNCRPKVFKLCPESKLGKVGLQNLGNTCYMNSGLQCLSNTKPLTRFILSDDYKQDINKENILGSKGNLIEEFAQLIKEMWWGTSHQVSPWGVKKAFSEFAKQFMGFFQQDSQEMLGYLVDGIHEDLNRVKSKPYIEDPEARGMTESQLADKFWENHLKRNNSIIVDLMHGQYRSEVECPDCHKVSITFDPFLMVTLPIPEKDMKVYEFMLVDFNETIRGRVHLPKGSNAGNVRDKACEVLGVSSENILMAEISMNTLKSILKPNMKVNKKINLIMYRQGLEENFDSEEYATLFLDFRRKSAGYSGQVIGNPFLFTVKKNITMEELHKEIYRFITKLKKMEVEDINKEFEKAFSNHYTRSYHSDPEFMLKVHNPYQFPCAICDRVACPGCNISFEQKSLKLYLNQCKESNLRISVIFSDRIYNTSFMNTVTDHPSCYGNSSSQEATSVQLSDCFQMFSKKEQLDDENVVYCSECKEHKRGFKKMGIFRLPKILVIHFKRFKQKKYNSSKNNKTVDFPIEGLDMSQFSVDQSGIYDLYAVSNHYGSLEGGHYTAYAKGADGIWRDFDDSSVSVVDDVQRTVVGSSAYVLFYERRAD